MLGGEIKENMVQIGGTRPSLPAAHSVALSILKGLPC